MFQEILGGVNFPLKIQLLGYILACNFQGLVDTYILLNNIFDIPQPVHSTQNRRVSALYWNGTPSMG